MTYGRVDSRFALAGSCLLALLACQAPAPQAPSTPQAAPISAGLSLSALKQIPVGKSPHGIGAGHGFIYNSDTGAAQLSIIDTKTQAVVKTLPFGAGNPGYVKPFHDGHHFLVADTKQGQLRVIDPAKDHQTLQTIAVGAGMDRLVISDDDRDVYISLTGEPKVVRLRFSADRAAAPQREEFAVGGVAGEQFKHRAIAVEAGWLVAPNSADNDVSLIDLASKAAQRVGGGNNPGPVAIGTQAGKAVAAVVGFKASNAIGLYDLPAGKLTRLDEVGQTPSDVGVDASLGRAYVTMSGSNEVAVIDYVAKRLVGRVPVGKRPVHIYLAPALQAAAEDDGHAHAHYRLQAAGAASHEWWVGNDDGGSVTVFDGESLRVKATIATGAGHHKMAFWGNFAYVSNLTDNTVSVVDRTAIR
ncbi:MAG: hypothetical protein VKP62_02180 [Candidatus Sericytochromatia bacterium]|nr:hypothetical protein [Candidatus Sericytochromatia bacterium]